MVEEFLGGVEVLFALPAFIHVISPFFLSHLSDSNGSPARYKGAALPDELRWHDVMVQVPCVRMIFIISGQHRTCTTNTGKTAGRNSFAANPTAVNMRTLACDFGFRLFYGITGSCGRD
jgi:hypothetical protein